MSVLDLPPGTIEAAGLYGARCGALIVGAPLFGAPTGFMTWRAAFISLVAVGLYAAQGTPLATQPGPLEYALLMLREVALGLVLSFALHGALLAVRAAGELITQEIGLGYAGLVDPMSGSSTSSVTLLHEIFFYLGLFLTDGHHALLRALAVSFEGLPVGDVSFARGAADAAVALLGPMLAAGIAFAAPILGLLFSTSMLVALLGRAVPQLNVLEIGFTLRTTIGLLALFLFAPAMAPALNGIYLALQDGLASSIHTLATT
ncbi:MAG: flagellar biosynthetic protein FliR [Planctomycetes bacterium]|nr:flagellar biosynthetic protein FliR [Planctomycetota bacterium]